MTGTGGRRVGGFAGRGGATETTAGLTEVLELVVLTAFSDCREPLEGMLAVDVDGTLVPLDVVEMRSPLSEAGSAPSERPDAMVPEDQSLAT